MSTVRKILACKADPIGPRAVGGVSINITEQMPNLHGDLKEAVRFYTRQAEAIEIALFYSLPGGVYDQILVKMMQRRASLFRVPLGEREP